MIVASLPLSMKLYELSAWETGARGFTYLDEGMVAYGFSPDGVPAYTVDFILQALVDNSSLEKSGVLHMLAGEVKADESFADAACRLAIDLFKGGALEKAA